jgi:hypothetical protein
MYTTCSEEIHANVRLDGGGCNLNILQGLKGKMDVILVNMLLINYDGRFVKPKKLRFAI